MMPVLVPVGAEVPEGYRVVGEPQDGMIMLVPTAAKADPYGSIFAPRAPTRVALARVDVDPYLRRGEGGKIEQVSGYHYERIKSGWFVGALKMGLDTDRPFGVATITPSGHIAKYAFPDADTAFRFKAQQTLETSPVVRLNARGELSRVTPKSEVPTTRTVYGVFRTPEGGYEVRPADIPWKKNKPKPYNPQTHSYQEADDPHPDPGAIRVFRTERRAQEEIASLKQAVAANKAAAAEKEATTVIDGLEVYVQPTGNVRIRDPESGLVGVFGPDGSLKYGTMKGHAGLEMRALAVLKSLRTGFGGTIATPRADTEPLYLKPSVNWDMVREARDQPTDQWITRMLRGQPIARYEGEEPPAESHLQALVAEVDKAMTPLVRDHEVYRGVGGEFLQGLKPGDTFEDPMWTATSVTRLPAVRWAQQGLWSTLGLMDEDDWEVYVEQFGLNPPRYHEWSRTGPPGEVAPLPVVMTIKVPKGTKALDVSGFDPKGPITKDPLERELLLQRGLRFRVVSREVKHGPLPWGGGVQHPVNMEATWEDVEVEVVAPGITDPRADTHPARTQTLHGALTDPLVPYEGTQAVTLDDQGTVVVVRNAQGQALEVFSSMEDARAFVRSHGWSGLTEPRADTHPAKTQTQGPSEGPKPLSVLYPPEDYSDITIPVTDLEVGDLIVRAEWAEWTEVFSDREVPRAEPAITRVTSKPRRYKSSMNDRRVSWSEDVVSGPSRYRYSDGTAAPGGRTSELIDPQVVEMPTKRVLRPRKNTLTEPRADTHPRISEANRGRTRVLVYTKGGGNAKPGSKPIKTFDNLSPKRAREFALEAEAEGYRVVVVQMSRGEERDDGTPSLGGRRPVRRPPDRP